MPAGEHPAHSRPREMAQQARVLAPGLRPEFDGWDPPAWQKNFHTSSSEFFPPTRREISSVSQHGIPVVLYVWTQATNTHGPELTPKLVNLPAES